MLLLGARPGRGKTMLGLSLLIDAVREGRRAVFFTLEYTDQEALSRIQSLDGKDHPPEIVTSEEISADLIVRHLTGSPRGSVAVIDYLQILDQQRAKPPLAEQLETLSHFARDTGTILAFLSQIDRSFDAALDALPGMADIRLPNAISSGVFSKACFLNAGQMRLQEVVRY